MPEQPQDDSDQADDMTMQHRLRECLQRHRPPQDAAGLRVPVLALLLAGCLETEPKSSEPLADAAADSALEHARKHLDPKYVCPMHPQIVRDEEGSCPICGMDLVEKLIDTRAGQQPTVEISNAVINSMGVRTAPVERSRLWRRMDTVGYVDYDELEPITTPQQSLATDTVIRTDKEDKTDNIAYEWEAGDKGLTDAAFARAARSSPRGRRRCSAMKP